MKKTVVVLLFSAFSNFYGAQAQSSIELIGKVVDKTGKGLDLATVSVQSATDSTLMKSEYTDEDGTYLITKVLAGNYIIRVHLFGYEPYQDSVMLDGPTNHVTIPPIVLNTAVYLMNEVTVAAKVPYIERKMDRTVVNVDAITSNAGTDVLEVLERAPGISIDNNGALLLKGRSGVAVFINDKPTYLSGSELESYLRSLPTGTVKQIEIMTNPPAKYEAAGNAGVINIILKKNKLEGFNGNLSLSYRQGQYRSSNNNFSLNYNKNKVSLSVNSNGGFWNSFQDLNINRYYKNEANERLSSFSQNSFGHRSGKYLNANIGVDYYLSDETTLGASYKINNSPSRNTIDNRAKVLDANEALTQSVVADNVTKGSFGNNVYNVYLNHKIDSLGSSISVDADYVNYSSGSDQLFKNYLYDNGGNLTFQDQINGDLPSIIKIYAAKTDYAKQLSNGTKFEAGLKTAFTKTDNEAIYSTTIDGVAEPDYELSNRFLYDEWINAAYLNYSQEFGAIGIQIGLRVESTKLSGNQLGNVIRPATSFTRNYTSAFPTFYASWKMDSLSNHVMIFSYGRRIDRPYFQDLNPFISPLDKFTFYAGNPDLLPTYSHNFSLSHTFKSLFTTTLNYSKTLDGINETLEIRDSIYYSRPGNIANSQSFSISLEGSIPITKWYNLNSYLALSHSKFESQLYTEKLKSQGTSYYLSATNSFDFGKGWGADLTGFYSSNLVYAQLFIKGYGQINIGVQKKILDKAGTLKLAVNDIFYTRHGSGIINNLRLTDADWNSTFDSRTATLTFSWRFGQSTLKKEKYNSNGSSDEQNRVKG